MIHLRHNYEIINRRKFITGTLAVGAWIAANSMTSAIIAGTLVAGTSVALSENNASKERHAMKSATHDADMKQQELALKAEKAAADAKDQATEEMRKKRAGQTHTILTTPLGDTTKADIKKPTLLGVG